MFSTLSSLLVLTEARRPDLDYEEKTVSKKDKITGQIIKDDAGKAVKVVDKVIANLAGRESATLTRAFKRYKRLLDVLKRMEAAHVQVNAQMKEELEDYFDAKDNVLTRVIETVSMTATLSKYVAAADKPKKTEVDYEKVIEQLSALVAEELQPKIIEIIAANTKVTDPTDSPVKLSIKMKDDGAAPVNEGVMDTLRGWVKSITKKWNEWCASYDKKLAKIKADAAKAGIVLESTVEDMTDEELERLVEQRWAAAMAAKQSLV
jgi:hypothetical protein